MPILSRRTFLVAGAAAAAGAAGWQRRLLADPLGMPIGCQTWPVRQSIGKDFEGTLRGLAGDGFQRIEMCSPPSYAGMGFGPLKALTATEMRDKIHAAGMGCESCHYGFTELQQSLEDRMAFAKDLGLTQMIISSFGIPNDAKLAEWTKAAQGANKIGEQTQKAGLQLWYHNHDMEFRKLDGELIYDRLMSELDPKLVKMQFQVSVVQLGYQAADYFEKYPGRYISMHLQDWSPKEKKEVALGQGEVDWKRLFAAAPKGGVKNYFVELDPPDLKASVPFLHRLS